MRYLILVIGFLLFTSSVHSQSDSGMCMEFKNLEKVTNKDLPRKIDEFTELTSIGVNCDSKIIKYVKRILVSGNEMQVGWEERKQRQHTQLHCNQDGLSRMVKWVAMDVMYDKDFKYLTTLVTAPTNCK